MRITTSKSKNSESFYITQSYTNAEGKSTSKTIRKLGTLAELSEQLHTDRDGVVEWANEQARLETLKYKSEKEDANAIFRLYIYYLVELLVRIISIAAYCSMMRMKFSIGIPIS